MPPRHHWHWHHRPSKGERLVLSDPQMEPFLDHTWRRWRIPIPIPIPSSDYSLYGAKPMSLIGCPRGMRLWSPISCLGIYLLDLRSPSPNSSERIAFMADWVCARFDYLCHLLWHLSFHDFTIFLPHSLSVYKYTRKNKR